MKSFRYYWCSSPNSIYGHYQALDAYWLKIQSNKRISSLLNSLATIHWFIFFIFYYLFHRPLSHMCMIHPIFLYMKTKRQTYAMAKSITQDVSIYSSKELIIHLFQEILVAMYIPWNMKMFFPWRPFQKEHKSLALLRIFLFLRF